MSPDDAWADSRWRDLRLEAAYHPLCSDPSRELTSALTGLVYALDLDRAAASQWAQMITQAGEDTGAAAVADWGRRLDDALSGAGWLAVFSCADLLLRGSVITGPAVRLALLLRGCALYFLNRGQEALANMDSVIELVPDDTYAKYALTNRGIARSQAGRHDEALADFNQADWRALGAVVDSRGWCLSGVGEVRLGGVLVSGPDPA